MSKDPAFPFYAQDFLTGVMHFSMEERGMYITLLAYQWAHGKIPKKRLGFILGSDWVNAWVAVGEKFVDVDDEFVANLRLEEEREKRARFKEKQVENGKRGGRKPKNNPDLTQIESQTHTQKKPLEYENENEEENESDKEEENENLIPTGKSKIDYEAIVQIFNSVCINLPKVSKLSEKRKSLLKNRIAESSLEALGDVFRKVSESRFLNGESSTGWKADFDWILNPSNYLKISEDNYKNPDHGTRNNNSATTDSDLKKSANDAVDKMFGITRSS